jgi:hypothetical protein
MSNAPWEEDFPAPEHGKVTDVGALEFAAAESGCAMTVKGRHQAEE